jgi:hypothetical protein
MHRRAIESGTFPQKETLDRSHTALFPYAGVEFSVNPTLSCLTADLVGT